MHLDKLQIVEILILVGFLTALFAIAIDADAAKEDELIIEKKYISTEERINHHVDVLLEREALKAEEIVEKAGAPYEHIALDDDYQIYLEERCNELGIDFFLAIALMFSESTYRADAVSDDGKSFGLMQINECWWDYMEKNYGLDVIDNPYDNIEAGLIILNDLQDKFPNDDAAVIQCYKCGEYRGRELLKEGIVISQASYVVLLAKELKE